MGLRTKVYTQPLQGNPASESRRRPHIHINACLRTLLFGSALRLSGVDNLILTINSAAEWTIMQNHAASSWALL